MTPRWAEQFAAEHGDKAVDWLTQAIDQRWYMLTKRVQTVDVEMEKNCLLRIMEDLERL